MEYKIDFEDVKFTLFDFLNLDQVTALPRYSGQSREIYQSVLEEALKFAKKEIAPLNESGDRVGAKIVNGQVEMPAGFKECLAKFAENGFMGIDIDPELSGLGLPSTVNIVIGEFVMGACPSFAFFHMLTRGDCDLLQHFATPEQKNLYVTKMTTGQWTGTMCLTEPQAGSAVGDITTTAKKNPDGSFSIQGTKIFITCGKHSLVENIVHLVLARVEGDAPGTKGISLFIVPANRVNPDGSVGTDNDIKLISIEHKMGIKASPTCLLQFGDQGKCIGYLVGEQSEGMKYMFYLMNEARLATGQQGVAIGAAAYESALGYAKERTQAGQAIINYPDVRRLLMTQKAYVEGLRALMFETAIWFDTASHHADPKVREEYLGLVGLMTPICKAFGSDMGFRVTELAIQTYGGYGYVQDYPVEQYMRDLKIASLYEGTNGIQAMDLIGRKFLRDKGQVLKKYFEKVGGYLKEATGQHQELGGLTDRVLKTVESFTRMAYAVAEGSAKNPNLPGLSATPFLRALGDIACAQLLVRRAAVALTQLAKNPPAERAQFLRGKVEAAKFYVHQILPEAELNITRILSGDQSAMADVL